MPNEPFWLTPGEVEEYDRLAVEQTGEPFYVRDRPMLESAVAAPRNHWHYTGAGIPVLTATVLLAIAKDHPFEQGNKRAALGAASGFATLNGYELLAWDGAYADLILDVLDKKISTATFVECFAPTVQPIGGRARSLRLRNSGQKLRRRKRRRERGE